MTHTPPKTIPILDPDTGYIAILQEWNGLAKRCIPHVFDTYKCYEPHLGSFTLDHHTHTGRDTGAVGRLVKTIHNARCALVDGPVIEGHYKVKDRSQTFVVWFRQDTGERLGIYLLGKCPNPIHNTLAEYRRQMERDGYPPEINRDYGPKPKDYR